LIRTLLKTINVLTLGYSHIKHDVASFKDEE